MPRPSRAKYRVLALGFAEGWPLGFADVGLDVGTEHHQADEATQPGLPSWLRRNFSLHLGP